MIKRWMCLLLAAGLMLVLGGCGGFGQNVNELLRAPALGQGQDAIQKALSAYLGEEPQYKFPLEGERRSPLVLEDFNGDGVAEGVLFYSIPPGSTVNADKGTKANIAVLEQIEGKWKVMYEQPGWGDSIASVEVAEMLPDGTRQLIVGYSTPNLAEKTLVLYKYTEGSLQPFTYPNKYESYLLGDFTGQGRTDLAVVSRGGIGSSAMMLNFVTGRDGFFAIQQESTVTLADNLLSCVGMKRSIGPDGQQYLVIDLIFKGDVLVSQFLVVSGAAEGVIYPREQDKAEQAVAVAATSRNSMMLLSRDIDGDGVVEIPRDKPIVTLDNDKNLCWVYWMDFIPPEPVIEQFGILDEDRSVYVPLPEDWNGQVVVTDGEGDKEWQVQQARTGARLVVLKVYEENETPPAGAIKVPGTARTYLLPQAGLTTAQREVLENMVLLS